MADDTPINDVSDTAFWVAYYRAKESERADALFRDPFAKRLVGERGKTIADSMPLTSRYTEWAVVSRTVIIDRFVQQSVADGVDAVVNLGAGLDARPYRMNLPATLEWIEVDHPTIIAHKSRVLEAERPTCKLTRVEVDLASSGQRKAFLEAAVPGAKRVLVLTEGVLPYLSPEQVAELSHDLLAQQRFACWVTEYFHPSVYRYLKLAARSSQMKNAPFRFFPDDWFGFFRGLGWRARETRYTGEIALEFKRRPPMPWWAWLLLPFMPRKVKEHALRTTGYVLFERA